MPPLQGSLAPDFSLKKCHRTRCSQHPRTLPLEPSPVLHAIRGRESLKLAEGLGEKRLTERLEKAKENGRLLLRENVHHPTLITANGSWASPSFAPKGLLCLEITETKPTAGSGSSQTGIFIVKPVR